MESRRISGSPILRLKSREKIRATNGWKRSMQKAVKEFKEDCAL